jgi:hypothetical protein
MMGWPRKKRAERDRDGKEVSPREGDRKTFELLDL